MTTMSQYGWLKKQDLINKKANAEGSVKLITTHAKLIFKYQCLSL